MIWMETRKKFSMATICARIMKAWWFHCNLQVKLSITVSVCKWREELSDCCAEDVKRMMPKKALHTLTPAHTLNCCCRMLRVYVLRGSDWAVGEQQTPMYESFMISMNSAFYYHPFSGLLVLEYKPCLTWRTHWFHFFSTFWVELYFNHPHWACTSSM